MSVASGERVVPSGSYPTSRLDWRAPVALVLSLLWFGGIGSVIAIVLAVAALRRGTGSSGERTMAYAAICIGCVGVVLPVVSIALLSASSGS
jgi:Trk-type K+ transport system membrane component